MKTSNANYLAGKTLLFWADIERRKLVSDVLAVLVVVTLLWSTSLPAIFIAIWLLVLVQTGHTAPVDAPQAGRSANRCADEFDA
ncbi:hypothetical protein KMZ29_09875 [Bradyrhizobium sediminis]|uniref:Uncharacterized protein n=1 Tax=Bradyrhizobium sediminis TaxID=2840469 RepID=A0A975NH25_9BRAD|nr:hypothetical protein [Bradyrhizobium sediminis]QWG14932.1 hypothetical protein KMZ29_09875 [Bradyrhizobium sediminis]